MSCRAYLSAAACLLAMAGTTAFGQAPTSGVRRFAATSMQTPPPAAAQPAEPGQEPAVDAAPDANGAVLDQGILNSNGGPLSDPYMSSGGCGGGANGCECMFPTCPPPPGLWARADFLYWWVKGQYTPPLVTTSPAGTGQGAAGDLPGATVLFGGNSINGQGRPGGRFTLGYWFDSCQSLGIESTTFFLQQTHTSYNSGISNGTPILARPFFNENTGAEDADLIAFPGLVAGQITALSTTKTFGTEVNLRKALSGSGNTRIDGIVGYRFLRFDEALEIDTNSTSTATGGSVPVGTTFGIRDSFGTTNQFNGVNLGLRWIWDRGGRFSFDLSGKTGLGNMRQQVSIEGNTVVTEPGGAAPVHENGGILALPRDAYGGNIGTYVRNQFSAVPELNTNLYYQFSPSIRFNIGYTLLYLTNVVRPGNEIDTRLDTNRFPPPLTATTPYPTFSFQNTSVWMQGINMGGEVRF